ATVTAPATAAATARPGAPGTTALTMPDHRLDPFRGRAGGSTGRALARQAAAKKPALEFRPIEGAPDGCCQVPPPGPNAVSSAPLCARALYGRYRETDPRRARQGARSR